VNNKYDTWHREILNKFGSTVGDGMKAFKETIQKARSQLETLSLDDSKDVTLFVTEI
jgi:dynein heavy chain 1